MTDLEKMQYINYMQLLDELENVSFGGIQLMLDGVRSDAHSIASLCVFQEDTDYLRDYRRNEDGRISELNFDKVKQS